MCIVHIRYDVYGCIWGFYSSDIHAYPDASLRVLRTEHGLSVFNTIACAQVFLATHQEHVNHHLVVDEVDRKDGSTDAGKDII